MEQLVVTRHPALVQYLREKEMISEETEVVEHASPEQIKGKHVIGVLPLPLAAMAESVTVVPMQVPQELRGEELTLEQVGRATVGEHKGRWQLQVGVRINRKK